MKDKIKHFLPLIVIISLITVAVIYLNTVKYGENGLLDVSGTIEAKEVTLASEFGGLISEVLVNEGDAVETGQILVKFDDEYLKTQLSQAQAALTQAQANYEQAQSLAELESIAAQQTLDTLYENEDLARARAQLDVVEAQDNLEMAQNVSLASSNAELDFLNTQEALDDLKEDRANMDYQRCKQSKVDALYAEYILAQDTYEEYRDDYEAHYAWKNDDDIGRANALSKMHAAEEAMDRAKINWDYCRDKSNQEDIAIKDAEISLTEAQLLEAKQEWDDYLIETGLTKAEVKITLAAAELSTAQINLDKLTEGPDPDAVELAEAQLNSAEPKVAVAQSQVEVAQAALEAIQVQLKKMSVSAPMNGIILERMVEMGEIIAPGAPVLSLAQLEDLTITVYVPEDRYGQVSIGDKAVVSVDSFPGETFSARVIHIADQAEFTPRNVQTGEGRRTTVYAIKLSLTNPDKRLKPGMPADVNFK